MRELVAFEAGGCERRVVQRVRVAGEEQRDAQRGDSGDELFVVAGAQVVLASVAVVTAPRIGVVGGSRYSTVPGRS